MNSPFIYASPTLSVEALKHSIAYKLMFTIGKDPSVANRHEWLNATLLAVKDRMVERWLRSNRAQLSQDVRQVYYLSMEFLLGRTLSNALLAMGIYDDTKAALDGARYILMERFAEELIQSRADEAMLLADLTAGVKPQALMAEIARLERAIEGMGAVNLAAHEELEQARARGDYLAAQSDDLEQAMATLENAIQKIDGESRQILQGTYDAVNAKMSEFFPTLFGGGHAELTLTGEDLLDAGTGRDPASEVCL